MERRFDAVVVAEYERAFASGDQFTGVAAVLAGLGVEVWLPEAGGRVDVDSPFHAALVTVLGAQSQREVLRSRHHVRWMFAQRVSHPPLVTEAEFVAV